MIEPAQRLHILLQRDLKLFDQRQKKVQPQATFSPLGGDVPIERCIVGDRLADRTVGGPSSLS